jgi:hypothetical protein
MINEGYETSERSEERKKIWPYFRLLKNKYRFSPSLGQITGFITEPHKLN